MITLRGKMILNSLIVSTFFFAAACGSFELNGQQSELNGEPETSRDRFVCKTGGEGVLLRVEPGSEDSLEGLPDNAVVVYSGEASGEYVKVTSKSSGKKGWIKARYLCIAPTVSSGKFTPNCSSKDITFKLPESGEGFGTYQYDELVYGNCATVQRIKELGRRILAKTKYPIYVGDLSAYGGGNLGRHQTHEFGDDVDVAIMGNTSTVFCSKYSEACYDRNASRALIKEVISMGGATGICFNDSVMINEFPGFVRYCDGHDDHYHIEWHN